jgi:hypothetical protein
MSIERFGNLTLFHYIMPDPPTTTTPSRHLLLLHRDNG